MAILKWAIVLSFSLPAYSQTVNVVSVGLNNPFGLAIDPTTVSASTTSFVIGNTLSDAVLKVLLPSGSLSVLLDVFSGLAEPSDLCYNPAGDLFISNGGNHPAAGSSQQFGNPPYITKRSSNGQTATSRFANLTGLASSSSYPAGPTLACDAAGNVYVGSGPRGNTPIIYKLTPAGSMSVYATMPGNCTGGMAFDSLGFLYVNAFCAGMTFRVSSTGSVATFIAAGSGLVTPTGIAVHLPSNTVFIADAGTNSVYKTSPNSSSLTVIASNATFAAIKSPIGIKVDTWGNVFVVCVGSSSVVSISNTTSAVSTVVVAGLSAPLGVCKTSSGLYSLAITYVNTTGAFNPAIVAVDQFSGLTTIVYTFQVLGAANVLGFVCDSQSNMYSLVTNGNGDFSTRLYRITPAGASSVAYTFNTWSVNIPSIDPQDNIWVTYNSLTTPPQTPQTALHYTIHQK
jgi:hypothetical protein